MRGRLLCHLLKLIFPPYSNYTPSLMCDPHLLSLQLRPQPCVSGLFLHQKCQLSTFMSWNPRACMVAWAPHALHPQFPDPRACFPTFQKVSDLFVVTKTAAQVLSTRTGTRVKARPGWAALRSPYVWPGNVSGYGRSGSFSHGCTSMETSMSNRFEVRSVEEKEA